MPSELSSGFSFKPLSMKTNFHFNSQIFTHGLCHLSIFAAEKFKYGAVLSQDAAAICNGTSVADTHEPENYLVNFLVSLPAEDRFAIAHQPRDLIK